MCSRDSADTNPLALFFWNGGLKTCVHFLFVLHVDILLKKGVEVTVGGRGLLNLSEPVRESDA